MGFVLAQQADLARRDDVPVALGRSVVIPVKRGRRHLRAPGRDWHRAERESSIAERGPREDRWERNILSASLLRRTGFSLLRRCECMPFACLELSGAALDATRPSCPVVGLTGRACQRFPAALPRDPSRRLGKQASGPGPSSRNRLGCALFPRPWQGSSRTK